MSVSILVVTTNRTWVSFFASGFVARTRQGKHVLHYTASGAEALNWLAGEIEPMLVAVLADINMPGMDGLQLLAEIKQPFPDLPVMMVTAYGDEERRKLAEEYGAAEFITKPVDFEMLKQQLRQLPQLLT